jgi:flagellar biosynthesis/type III secretory pathway chaperone
MGKRRSKGSSEVEELRGILREKEKLIKQLLKRLGQSRKQAERLESLVPEESFIDDFRPIVEVVNKDLCPNCGKDIKPIDLGNRKLLNCNNCGYRKTEKNEG